MNKTLVAGTGVRRVDVPAIAIDISWQYIQENKEKFNYQQKDYVFFVVGDLKHLPFKNKSFSSIINIEVLEHIQKKEQVLSEFSRVSINHAHLHLQTSTRYCDQLLGKLSKRYYTINSSNHHQYCVEWYEVINLVKRYGYRIYDEKFLFSPRWFFICLCMDLLRLNLDSSGTLTGKGAKYIQKIGYKLDKHIYPLFTYLNSKLKGKWNKYAKSILLEAEKEE